jgi:hypothetical protein
MSACTNLFYGCVKSGGGPFGNLEKIQGLHIYIYVLVLGGLAGWGVPKSFAANDLRPA